MFQILTNQSTISFNLKVFLKIRFSKNQNLVTPTRKVTKAAPLSQIIVITKTPVTPLNYRENIAVSHINIFSMHKVCSVVKNCLRKTQKLLHIDDELSTTCSLLTRHTYQMELLAHTVHSSITEGSRMTNDSLRLKYLSLMLHFPWQNMSSCQ